MLEKDSISRIKLLLKAYPKGLTITDISSKLKINRNSVSKYLEVLLISGQVETQSYGTARVFFLTHRIPISAMLSISSHLVLTLDENKKVIFCNDNFLSFFGIARDQIVGHHIIEIYRLGVPNIIFSDLFSDILVNPDHNHETAITKENETFYFHIKGINTVFDDGCRGITIVMKDVTKERKYQIELELNEARYRGIVEDQTEFICRFLPNGTLTFINDAFAKFLSGTPKDLVNTCRIPGISCEDVALWDQACKSLDREHPVTTIECRMPDGTDRICWIAWTIRGLFDDTDVCREYQAVGRDITEKKEADERIQENTTQMAFFSRILQDFTELPPDADIYDAIGTGLHDLIPSAVITVNAYDQGSGTLTVRAVKGDTARDYAVRHFGKHIIGYKICVDEDVPEPVLNGKVHHIEKDLYNILFRHLPKDACEKITRDLNLGKFYSVGLVWNGVLFGNITFGLQRGIPLTDAPLIEIYARAASIALQRWIAEGKLKESELKLAEEALKASENYLLKIFNSTQSGLVVIDPETHTIFDVNATAIELIGKKKSEIIGSSCKALFCLAEGDVCPVTDLHQNIVRKECRFLTNSGEKKIVLKTVVPVQLGTRPYFLESVLDITERKKAEDALRESEKKFRDLAEMLPQSVWECDAEGNLTFANPGSFRMYGYELKDIDHGLNIWQMMHPDDRERMKGEFVQGFMRGPSEFPEYHQYTGLRKDGSTMPVEIYATIIVRDGQPVGMRGIGIDVTEQKKSEKALRETEERYKSLFDRSLDCVYIHDFSGNFIDANLAALSLLGYTRDEITSLNFASLLTPDQVSTALLVNQEILATGCQQMSTEFRVRRKDGGFVEVIATAALLCKNGKPYAIQSIAHDITERKRVEEALHEAHLRMKTVLDGIVDTFYSLDEMWRFTTVNPVAEKAPFGRPASELIGSVIWELYPNLVGTRIHQHYLDAAKNYTLEHYEAQSPLNGRWYEVFMQGRRGGVDVYMRDITERKEIEKALYEANRKLNLLSSITRHDINNKLTVLQGYLALMKDMQTDPTLGEYFGKISTAAQEISDMIRFTKEYESIGVRGTVWQDCRTLIDTAAKQAPLGHVTVKNDIPSGTEVFADPLIVKVCYNLMDNAVRYGGKITTIRFSDQAAGNDYVVMCEDDGAGVPVGDKEKIFLRAFGKNTGFGLFLSREILSITGITIRETGEPGKGARFEIVIPKEAYRFAGTSG